MTRAAGWQDSSDPSTWPQRTPPRDLVQRGILPNEPLRQGSGSPGPSAHDIFGNELAVVLRRQPRALEHLLAREPAPLLGALSDVGVRADEVAETPVPHERSDEQVAVAPPLVENIAAANRRQKFCEFSVTFTAAQSQPAEG